MGSSSSSGKKVIQKGYVDVWLPCLLIQQQANHRKPKPIYTVYLVDDSLETNLNPEYYNRFFDCLNCKFKCTVRSCMN